jgi:alkylated DNA repair dioxygenase AlkB
MSTFLKKLGFTVHPDYITESLEEALVKQINKSTVSKGGEKRNSIQRYGSDVPYKGKIVSREIPEWLDTLAFYLVKGGLLEKKPDSVSINEYFKGQKIDYHIDSKGSGEIITILSLLSPAIMRFKKGNEVHVAEIPPRSIIQLKDEIRNNWMHSLDPVEDTRYSIVFRCSKT